MEKIRTFLASLKDMEAAKRLVAPDARFIAVREKRYAGLPLYGLFTGHDGLEAFVKGLDNTFDTQFFAIDALLEDDGQGFATGRFHHRVRKSSRDFISHWALHCRFADGLITHYRFFEDNAALEEAFGLTTQSREEI